MQLFLENGFQSHPSGKIHSLILAPLSQNVYSLYSLHRIHRFISESEFQLLLPHHRSELTEIDKLISDLVTYVKALPERTCESAIVPSISHISTETTENTPFSSSTGTRNLLFQSPPSVITMARSAVDGFTPTDQETYIFNAVVRAINDELVPFWSELTNKSITFKLHDLCVDDVYREAFQLYLHHVARIAIK